MTNNDTNNNNSNCWNVKVHL